MRVGNILVGTTWASVTPTSAAGGPSITTFTPTSGPAGTVVTITGTNFTGATAVTFNGLAATIFAVDSPTQITATVPAGATTGPIAVTTPVGFNSSADNFTVPSATVSLPAQILEGATGTGTVTLTFAPASDVVVSLISSSPSDLVVPVSVTVAAGFTTADFEIQAPLDGTVDADVVVTVTPTSTGFVGIPANITVKNIDLSTVALTSGGYTQSFSGFTGAATLPLGWSLTGSAQTYSEWGSTTTGAKFSSASVNVFGFKHSGNSGVVQQVLTLRNETGSAITDLTVAYNGRTFANTGDGRDPAYTVTVDGQTVSALGYSTSDGDDVVRSVSLSGLTIAPNQVFQIIWSSDGSSAGSPGSNTRKQIGISNVSVSPTAALLSPSVSGLTVPTAQISQTSAGGVSANVTSDGGSAITARGFVYAPTSVNPDPTIGGTGVVNLADPLAEVGQMVTTLSPLTASTSYSVKAYAINAQGTTYTSVQNFTTLAPPASFTGNYQYPFDNFTGVSGLPGEWTAISSTGVQAYVGLWNSSSSNGGFYGGVSGPGVLGYTHTGSTGTLAVTLRLINNTGSTLTQLNVGYLGRVERVANTRTPEWKVTVAGVAAPDLTYSTSAGIDENKTATVTGLNVAPGDSFTIVWSCDRGIGTDSSRRIGLANVIVSTSAITIPNIVTSTDSITDLKAVPSQPGTPQNFSVSGSNLSGDIAVAAPAGFEIVRLPGFTYQDSLSLPAEAGTVPPTELAVRLKAQAAGSPSGSVRLESQGATTRNISVSGTVSQPSTVINLSTNVISGLTTTQGTPSLPTNFTVAATGLGSSNLVVEVTSGNAYEISTNNFVNATNRVSFASTGGVVATNSVEVRISSSAVPSANLTGTINVSGAGQAASVALTNGVVNVRPGGPVITPSTSSINFGSLIFTNTPTAPQNFTVSGENLEPGAGINAAVSGNFEIATNASPASWLTSLSGLTNGSSIFVRLKQASRPAGGAADQNGAIALSSSNALAANVSLSARVTWPAATITRNPASLTLNRVEGEPPPVTNFVVSASNVVGSLTIDPPTGYEWTVNTNNPSSWRNGLDQILAPEGTVTNTTVFVRMTNSSPGSYPGTLALRAPSASGVSPVQADVSLNGSVVAKPVITVDPAALDSFVTVQSKASTNQTFKVRATNVLGDVKLAISNTTPTSANALYEISTNSIDFSNEITLPAVDAPAAAARRVAAAIPTVIASDNAGSANYPGGAWANGANGGTGFQGWQLSGAAGGVGGFAGNFIGSAANNGVPIANYSALYTGGVAFSTYAGGNSGAFQDAVRPFAVPLQVGDVLTHSIGICFDNGNKGFALLDGTNEVFFFNVNNSGYSWTGGGSATMTPWPGVRENGVVINFSITRTATGFDYAISSPQDPNLTRSGSVTASGITALKYYISDAGGGDGGNLYFNNLQVTSSGGGGSSKIVPETTIYVRIAADALAQSPQTAETVAASVLATSDKADTQQVTLEGVVNPRTPPTVDVTGTNFNFFAAVAGGMATQSMQVGGSNLWTAITVDSQSPFVVSTNRAGGFNSQAVLTPDANEVVASTNVYVRFAPAADAAAGVVTNSISVSSAPASPQSFNVAGRVYPANVSGPQGAIDFIASPLGWFTTTTNTPSAPQAFFVSGVGLTQNLLVTAPEGFEVSPFNNGPYEKNVDFMIVPGASTVSGQLYVRMAASSTPGTVLGDLLLSSGGATLATADLQGTVFGQSSGAEAVVKPASLTGFSASVGNPSADQAFTLAARSLTAPTLTLAASAGYEISIDGGKTYATTAGLAATADGNTWILPPANITVRLSATASPGLVVAGTVSVTNGTPPTALATVTLGGSVAGAPDVQATANFVSFLGVKSPPKFTEQAFAVSGSWLTQNLSVTAPANFQVSLNGTNWSSSVSIASASSGNTGGVVPQTTVFARIAPSAPNGAVSGNLTVSSSGQQQTLPVQGEVYATPPPAKIDVDSKNLTGFVTTVGTPSAAQTLLVDGINLNGPITVKAPPGFRVDPDSIQPVAGVVKGAVVSVWVAAANAPEFLNGKIDLESVGAAPVQIAVSASVLGIPGAPAQSFNTGTGPGGTPAGTKPAVMGIVRDPSNPNGLFYIAGNFTTYNGVKAPGIVRLRADGSVDTSFNPDADPNKPSRVAAGPNAPIRAIAVQSTKDGNLVLVGGDFTTFNGQPAKHLVRLLPNGAVDETFQPGAGDTVRALSVQWDGKILVGGDFERFGGRPANFVVRLQPGGAVDTSFRTGGDFGPNAPVHALSLDSAGRVYIGGWFGGVDGLPSNRIARLLPDGKFDPTFNVRGGVGNNIQAANQDPYRTGTITSGLVNAIVVTQSGRVIVGGDFNTAAGRPGLAYRLAAFNPNGTPVLDFNNRARTDGEVTSLALLPDGRIAVGGTFTFLDFKWNPGLAIINQLGVPDPSFFAPANAGQTLGLQALAVLPDGNLLFGGDFAKVNGATQSGVGMMYTTDGLLPLISSGTQLTGVADRGFLYLTTTTAINPAGISYSWKAATDSSLPPGLQLGSLGAGVISGTPTKAGIYRFTLTATNGAGSSTADITLTVVDPPSASTSTKVNPQPPAAPQAPAVQVRAGRYVGLLARAEVNRQNGGLVDLTVKANRSALGSVLINGHKRAFSGTLDRAGRLQTKTKALKGQPFYDIELGYVAAPKGASRITGSVRQGATRRATFTANLSPWSVSQPATKLAGRYHAALQAQSAPARSVSAGGGLIALTVQPAGTVRMQGQLADGNAFTWSGCLGADGVVPVHIALPSGALLDGTLQLRNGTVQGSLLWVSTRPAAKWRVTLKVQGGVYRPGTEARRALGTGVPGGQLALAVAGGPLPRKTTAVVTVARDGTLASAAPIGLSGGRFDPRTGIFTGRLAAGGSRTAAGKLHALWIPQLGAAHGLVTWSAGSAPVTLRPPAKR